MLALQAQRPPGLGFTFGVQILASEGTQLSLPMGFLEETPWVSFSPTSSNSVIITLALH